MRGRAKFDRSTGRAGMSSTCTSRWHPPGPSITRWTRRYASPSSGISVANWSYGPRAADSVDPLTSSQNLVAASKVVEGRSRNAVSHRTPTGAMVAAYAGRQCGSERMVGPMVVGLDVPPLWLRDACTCGECRDAFSGQRLQSVLTLDPETGISSWRDDGDEVEVTFVPDGHVSRFSRSWLSANAPGRVEVFDDRSERHRPPWRAVDLGGRPPDVAWRDLRSAVEPRAAALSALLRTGVLLVRDVPVEPGMVLAVARLFGYVRTTNYGDLFDVRVEPRPVNLAYTGRAIAPHTDNPYREPVPGIQLLHCLQSSPGGGENVFIDGFAAAALVRDEDPQAFATLTSTPLTFRYEDADTLLRASGPIITVNPAGDVRAIRWNDRSVEPPTVAPDAVAEVYRAMREFASVLERSDLHLHVTLAPGECIVFDNTRILHARTAFDGGSGARHLQGCYADLDGLTSAVAVLRREGS